ncbi:MAG: sugar transferase [Syntrophorhabdaceae bacterium]|nr:sugar transferase [Syntrophorhabdaceae bacterium]
MIKRLVDMVFTVILLIITSIPMLVIAFMVKVTSRGPILYWSDRVGIHNKIFKMPKFRTMFTDTPAVATHLLVNAVDHVTSVGSFLRKLSLDELPQLWSILKGDMSLVGPRPALYNQYDLISLRTERGVHRIMPGVTGWAQINGRDDIPIPLKVKFDEFYLKHRSFLFDMKIIFLTIMKAIRAEGVKH